MSYAAMLKPMMEMLCNKLNTDLSNAHYRPFYTEQAASTTVECSIKLTLGNMIPQGIGSGNYDHTGWIYFDFGSNEERAAEELTDAIDELLDWLDVTYTKGTGYTYSGTTIRDLKQIPYQGYAQPRDLFLHDMIMVEFWWEREA